MVSYLFPADPLGGRSWRVDDHFAGEYEVASGSNSVGLIDSYSLGDRVRMQLPEGFESPVVYRGWMLNDEEYRSMQLALETRGFTLLTGLSAYLQAHSMEGWIGGFSELTPATAMLNVGISEDELLAAAATLPGEHGFFLKGSVKSEPGFSRAQTAEELPGLLERFRDFSGIAEDGKIALRSFVPLDSTVAEIRTWWVDGWLVSMDVHPNFYGKDLRDPLDHVKQLSLADSAIDFTAKLQRPIQGLDSKFLTADIALTAAGDWILLELGDGQVSGLPEGYGEEGYLCFYGALGNELGRL